VSKELVFRAKAVSDMRPMRALKQNSVAVALLSCAGSYQVVQLPEREAELYPLSQTPRRGSGHCG
jgi:hypothetical protein